MSDTHTPLPMINSLAEALAKAQMQIKPPAKNRHVDFIAKTGLRVKYSYADLADVIEALREPLGSNGLSVCHLLEYDGEYYGLKTMLMHTTGQSLSTWYPLPDPDNVKAQDFGSALTYARRYSLSSLVGIASEEDDDGANAPDPKGKGKSKPHEPQPQPNFEDTFPIEQEFPLSPLETLVQHVRHKNIPSQDMPGIIKRAVGREARSSELNDDELFAVIQYINKLK